MIGMVMGSGWTKSDDERKCHNGRAPIEAGNRVYQMDEYGSEFEE